MTASLPRRLRSRLVVRIYFVGLLQFAIVAGVLLLFAVQRRTPHMLPHTLQFVASTLAQLQDRPLELEREVSRVEETFHWRLAVYDGTGTMLATSKVPPSPPAPKPRSSSAPIPVTFPSGSPGSVLFNVPPPPPMPGLIPTVLLIMVVAGVASWLTARSLAVPLRQLSAAAYAFGQGQLGTRLIMNRADELGEVANAFDQMADQVAKALRAEKELLANISHELRTPLQRIRIAVEIGFEGDARAAQESLAEISDDLKELTRMVEDILTAARLSLQAGTEGLEVTGVHREDIGLDQLLVKAEVRFRAGHPERRLRLELRDSLPTIHVDPVLMRRVVDNLLDNARKYSEGAEADIVLRGFASGDSAIIEVQDGGVGIGAEDLQRVFQPFFRVDRSRARETGGLGLGLSLARRIVESHGGKIELSSQPGQGTLARVALPLHHEQHLARRLA